MIKMLINWLKEIFGYEKIMVKDFLPNQERFSHPEYFEPCLVNGKKWVPPIPGLVEDEVVILDRCEGKSTKEIERLLENCSNPNKRKIYRKILKKRYGAKTQ